MIEVDHANRKHAKLSASSSARWLSCTASVKASENSVNKGSSFAQEGTRAHEVADMCLQSGNDAEHYVGQTVEGGEVTGEMAVYVQQYVDYIHDLKGVMFPEQRVDFSNYIPNGFGTSDAIVIDEDKKHCDIVDLKYGKGIAVYADNNTQGMLYAVGVLNDYCFIYDIETITIHIVQPRIHNFSDWTITVKELHEWAKWAQGQAEEALSDNAKFNPSEKACQWCDVKATCKALHDYTHSIIASDFDDLDEDTSRLSDDQLKLVHDNAKLIKSYLDAVESHVRSKLESGEGFKGYKLVAGRSIRKWKDCASDVLESEVGDEAFTTKLKGITAIESLVGKKKLAEMGLTEKPEGKPTVVPESDKRKAIDTTSIFENLD